MRFQSQFLLFLLPTVKIFASSGYGISLTLQSPLIQETQAGTIITATFLVNNESDQDNTFLISLNLPPDWISIPFEEPFIELKGRETKVVWVAIRVPPNALAGTYPIRCSLQGREHPSLTSESSFSVLVLSRSALETSIKEVPKYKIAGENYTITFNLTNTGNIENNIKIKITDSSQFNIISNADSPLHLNPGETKEVAIKVQSPEDLKTVTRHFVFISAQIEEDPDCLNHLSTTVDIFPQNNAKIENYEYLPMKTVLGYGMKNQKKQLFVEQYGEGTLDDDKKKTSIFSLESHSLAIRM